MAAALSGKPHISVLSIDDIETIIKGELPDGSPLARYGLEEAVTELVKRIRIGEGRLPREKRLRVSPEAADVMPSGTAQAVGAVFSAPSAASAEEGHPSTPQRGLAPLSAAASASPSPSGRAPKRQREEGEAAAEERSLVGVRTPFTAYAEYKKFFFQKPSFFTFPHFVKPLDLVGSWALLTKDEKLSADESIELLHAIRSSKYPTDLRLFAAAIASSKPERIHDLLVYISCVAYNYDGDHLVHSKALSRISKFLMAASFPQRTLPRYVRAIAHALPPGREYAPLRNGLFDIALQAAFYDSLSAPRSTSAIIHLVSKRVYQVALLLKDLPDEVLDQKELAEVLSLHVPLIPRLSELVKRLKEPAV